MQIEYILDRDIFDESIREIAKKKVVINLGSATRFHKQLLEYRFLFKNIHYYVLDIHSHPELDIIADIQNLPLKNNCIEGVICTDVLDFVAQPLKAVEEIHRVLNKEGLAFVSVLFLHPYRASKVRKDFYRFTKDGLEYMFRNFSEMKLQPCGGYTNTLLNFMTGFKLRNRYLINILERPLCILVKFLCRKTINNLHNPIGFNILLKK